MIVVDASAAISALLVDGTARHRIAQDRLHAPHLIDTEVVDALRKLAQRSRVTDAAASRALEGWQRIAIRRYPTSGMLERCWALRHNVSAYDASYIALAETLGCNLVTADGRLAGASGPRCVIETVPH